MRFVCWLWRGRGFWKRTATYDVQHVEALASMLRRHGGYRLACVHDGSFQMPEGVQGVPMPAHVADLPNYLPKLWAWSPEFHERIGERFASIDLDVVLLGDPAAELYGPEPVRIWDSAVGEPYNSSLFVLTPGTGHEVWERMTPAAVEAARKASTRWTGDQSWIAHVLGPHLPTFGEGSGIIRYRPSKHRHEAPADARAVFLCGPYDPRTEAQGSTWIKQAWR